MSPRDAKKDQLFEKMLERSDKQMEQQLFELTEHSQVLAFSYFLQSWSLLLRSCCSDRFNQSG